MLSEHSKNSLPRRKMIVSLKCVKCGSAYEYNWTYRLGKIEMDIKRNSHHEIQKKIHKMLCPYCRIQYDVTNIRFYKRENRNLTLIYNEIVDKPIYKPSEYYNLNFGSKGDGKGYSIIPKEEEPEIKPIRQRVCPTCGHSYNGGPICPNRMLHPKPKKPLSHRLTVPKEAALKEKLKESHRTHAPLDRD